MSSVATSKHWLDYIMAESTSLRLISLVRLHDVISDSISHYLVFEL